MPWEGQKLNKIVSSFKKNTARHIGILVALVLMLILWFFVAPGFYSIQNISNALRTSSVNTLITFGMTFSLIIGGIDLTVGRVAALTGVVSSVAILSGLPWYVAILLGVIVGSLFGLMNGLIIAFTGIPPFIATIGMQFVARGLAFMAGSGSSIMVSDQGFYEFGNGYTFGIPNPVIIVLIVFVILVFVLNRTTYGKQMYALGENEVAADFSGINTKKVKVISYVISGTLAGLAGVILAARMMSGQPVVGDGFDGDAVASAVIGGVSIAGGQGSMSGALLGGLIFGFLTNGLNIWGINSYWQSIIKGIIILSAVILDVISKRSKVKRQNKQIQKNLNTENVTKTEAIRDVST